MAAPPPAIDFSDDEVVPIRELVELYESVGWLLYVADPDALARAVDRSTYVVTARNAEGELVGLARCLTDDVSILHIQDVLVRPDHQRQGIGLVLLGRILAVYDHVRQKQLLGDGEPGLAAFVEALGFVNLADLRSTGLNAYLHLAGPDD